MNKKGDTPLHWAVYTDKSRVVKLLVMHGADIDAKGADGMREGKREGEERREEGGDKGKETRRNDRRHIDVHLFRFLPSGHCPQN